MTRPAALRRRGAVPSAAAGYVASGLAALLSAGIAGSLVLFRRDLAAARRRLARLPTDTYGSEYGRIEYLLVGDGEPTLLVSHGITGGVDQAASLARDWHQLPKGCRLLHLSRFGYLRSEAPDGATAQTQAAAYAALLDHLGIERVVVVGNSAGGAAAIWFALTFPERAAGLILLSSAVPGPAAKPIPRFVAEHDFAYWAAVELAPEILLGLLLPEPVLATYTRQQKRFAVEHALAAALPISERAVGIALDYADALPAMNTIPFEQVGVPTLIVQSDDDPRELAGAEEMARRIPDSRLLTFSGGHFLLGHEQQIQTALGAFVAERSRSYAREAR